MEFSQRRDGSLDVYMKGDWTGTVQQLPSGNWAYVSRYADIVGIGVTIWGAVYAVEIRRQARKDSSEAADPG